MKTLRFHVLALTVAFLALSNVAHAGSVTLAWDTNPDRVVFGYRFYWGTAPGQYPNSLDVRTATSVTVPNLVDGKAYYFVVRGLQLLNAESAPLDQVSRRVGIPFMVRNDSMLTRRRTWSSTGETLENGLSFPRGSISTAR